MDPWIRGRSGGLSRGVTHAQYLFDPTAPLTKEVFGEYARFFDQHLAK